MKGNSSALNHKRMTENFIFCEQKKSNGRKKKKKKKAYPLGDHAKEVTLAMAGEPGRIVELCRKFVLLLFFSHPPSAGAETEAEAEESMATTTAGPSPASIAGLAWLGLARLLLVPA